MASDISIYAELLSNIRQISIAATLPSPSETATRATLAANGLDLKVFHRGQTRHVRLPGKAALGASILPIEKPGATTLALRLPLDPNHPSANTVSQHGVSLWSATDLEADSGVGCRKCGAPIVEPSSVVWKDLPSENWAEMMEFWHCHKPAVDHQHSHRHYDTGKADEASLAARGYGASSTISAQKGVGFVDLTALLFAETDCRGIRFSLSGSVQGSPNRNDLMETQSRSLNIFCSSCHAQLGYFNFRIAAVTLLKWQVSCKSASKALPGIPECLAATLLSTISRSGSSKSLITPRADAEDTTAPVIRIWVLNSGIVYSSSAVAQPTPAIKLLYQLISQEEADRLLEGMNCDAQEINLPPKAIGEVIQHLDESNLLLPSKERTLREWKVGLLSK